MEFAGHEYKSCKLFFGGDSDDRLSRKYLYLLKSLAFGIVTGKTVAAQTVGSFNQAQERLAERANPSLHRGNVTRAWLGWTVGVGVEKSDDISTFLFTREDGFTVELNARAAADRALQLASAP
jgi:hypothetical protein